MQAIFTACGGQRLAWRVEGTSTSLVSEVGVHDCSKGRQASAQLDQHEDGWKVSSRLADDRYFLRTEAARNCWRCGIQATYNLWRGQYNGANLFMQSSIYSKTPQALNDLVSASV